MPDREIFDIVVRTNTQEAENALRSLRTAFEELRTTARRSGNDIERSFTESLVRTARASSRRFSTEINRSFRTVGTSSSQSFVREFQKTATSGVQDASKVISSRLGQSLRQDITPQLDEVRNKIQDALGGSGGGGAGGGGTSPFSRLSASIITLNQGLELTQRLIGGATRVARGFVDALQEAARVEGLERSFSTLQESIGADATASINGLREATRGLVSDLDLFQSANQAVLLGVDDGSGAFQQLTADAIKLGQAMGVTAKDAVDSLVIGIGRQSRLVLDNLGVVVKAEEAYKAFADQLGVTVDQLNDAGKRAAFTEAAFEAVRQKAAELADATETAGIASQRIIATFSNLRSELLQNLSANENLTNALRQFNDVLINIDLDAFANDLAEVAGAIINFASIVIEQGVFAIREITENLRIFTNFAGQISNAFSQIDFSTGFRATRSFIGALREVSLETAILEEASKRQTNIVAQMAKATDEARKTFTGKGRAVKTVSDALTEYTGNSDKATASTTKLTDEQKKQIQETRRLDGAFEKLRDTVTSITPEFITLRDTAVDLYEEVKQGTLDFDDFRTALEEMARASGLTKRDLANLLPEIVKVGEESNKAEEEVQKLKDALQEDIDGSLFGGLLDDLTSGGFADLLGGLSEGAQGAILGGLSGITDSLAGALGGILEGSFNSDSAEELGRGIGGSIGRAAGDAILPGLGQFTELIGAEIGEDIAEIGQSTRDTLQGVGAILGGLPGLVLGDAIGNLFNDDPEPFREARDNFVGALNNAFTEAGIEENDFDFGVNGFFQIDEDAFNEIRISAEEAREVFGEAFGSNTSVIGDELFTNQASIDASGIAPDLRAQFEGIATAFRESFDLSPELEGLASQLGTVFALNLQDASGLNEFQLALQRADVNVEDLGVALEEAFLAGDISAGEFLNSLSAVEDLAAVGIPGAFGAVDLAFQNFLDGATVSGDRAVDALQDIAAEAEDLGAETFEDLRRVLEERGFDTQQIEQFFNTLQERGIQTLEQLENVSAFDAAGIVSSLEQTGFAFTEVSDDIEGAIERIEDFRNNAETEIVTRWRIETTVTGDQIPSEVATATGVDDANFEGIAQ